MWVSEIKTKNLAIIRVHLVQSKSKNKKEDLAGSWLANRLWVSLDVRPYLLLFGDTLIRPLFSFWWFISICSGPQAENSTLKVKKVGYYPTIDYHIYSIFFFKYIYSFSSIFVLLCLIWYELNWKDFENPVISLYNLLFVNNEIMMHTSVLKADLKVSSIAYHNNASSHKDNGQTEPR